MTQQLHTGFLATRSVLFSLGLLILSVISSAPIANAAPASPALAQGKLDQVFVWNARRGEIKVEAGRVVKDEVGGVEWESADGKKKSSEKAEIVRQVIFGDVPSSFTDGQAYADRGDMENAVASMRDAAGDSDARDVVRAAAAQHVIESLLQWGATDPSRFAEAASEAESFLSDYSTSRLLPNVRAMLGRAQHLSGDAAKAATTFRSLFEESATNAPGYTLPICAGAGLEAADCLLEEGNTQEAREILATLDTRLAKSLNEIEDNDPNRPLLEAQRATAGLGEGYALLASAGQERAARGFFDSRLEAAKKGSNALKFGTWLGLAQSLQAAGEHREAQIWFSRVASIDPGSDLLGGFLGGHDRSARALLGMAETQLAIGGDKAEEAARRWIDELKKNYGATPAAVRAATLLPQ